MYRAPESCVFYDGQELVGHEADDHRVPYVGCPNRQIQPVGDEDKYGKGLQKDHYLILFEPFNIYKLVD